MCREHSQWVENTVISTALGSMHLPGPSIHFSGSWKHHEGPVPGGQWVFSGKLVLKTLLADTNLQDPRNMWLGTCNLLTACWVFRLQS